MSDKQLPGEWVEATISEIADVNPKKIDAAPETVAGFVPMSHAPTNFSGNLEFEEKYWSEIKKSYTNFKEHDVLVAKVTPCFENGKAAIVKGLPNKIGAGSSEFYVIRPAIQEISSRFLFSIVKSYKFVSEGAANMTGAVGLRRVPRSFVENFPVLVPPLAEQKVIADKLDTLLGQVEATKARLERIPEILKTFRQSVLSAAVSGKLTVEWREKFKPEMVDIASISKEQFSTGLTMGNFGKKMDKSPDISGDENGKFVSHIAGWLPIRIGALCECVVPNRDKPKSFSGGYHWLLTPNFDEQSIWIDYKEIESGLSEEEVITYRAKIIKPGNVIMTCVGRVGLSAVLEESSVINQQLHAFKVNSHIKAEYLAYCVRANVEYYESKATSTTVKYLNKTACNSLPIPLPTIEEQDEIIRRVEELFAFADSIEQKTNASLQRVNKLTQSILAKAFRGELTANWRAANPELISGENSAEALLVIIKNERAKLSQTKKGRGKSVEN
nr:restriction endonuclease subunit S [Alteromonas macleodii]|tara:strand:+ start:279 stop:1778 length:1500 start_codon:yes stop_codon:yes gene_type:complete